MGDLSPEARPRVAYRRHCEGCLTRVEVQLPSSEQLSDLATSPARIDDPAKTTCPNRRANVLVSRVVKGSDGRNPEAGSNPRCRRSRIQQARQRRRGADACPAARAPQRSDRPHHHDTTLWERLSLDLLPEAERIIVAARRAATTPRRDFPDRRSGRITAHLPDCDPSSTVRCKLSARKSEAICCAELSRLPSPIAPITLSDPPPTSRAAGQGLAAVPLPSNSGSLAMLVLRSWPSLTSRVRVTTVWALRPGDDHRND
jgi:hypothetical protein